MAEKAQAPEAAERLKVLCKNAIRQAEKYKIDDENGTMNVKRVYAVNMSSIFFKIEALKIKTIS